MSLEKIALKVFNRYGKDVPLSAGNVVQYAKLYKFNLDIKEVFKITIPAMVKKGLIKEGDDTAFGRYNYMITKKGKLICSIKTVSIKVAIAIFALILAVMSLDRVYVSMLAFAIFVLDIYSITQDI